jgi:hypothetical protein
MIAQHVIKEAAKDAKQLGDPMREVEGKFYWWNETWTELHGPYDTKEQAKAALAEYAKTL